MCYVNLSAVSRQDWTSPFLFGLLFFSFSPRYIAVVAVVADQLLPFVGDMRGEGCNPIQDGKDGEVFLEDGIHLRPIENRFRLLLVSHFLHRKWRTEDILGQAFPYPAVPAFDFDLIVNAETGIFPGQKLFDQFSADLFLRPAPLSGAGI